MTLQLVTPHSPVKDELPRTKAGKTPIQILHEYGTASGQTPAYVMEKAGGQPHQPSFVFSVTVGEVCCQGWAFLCKQGFIAACVCFLDTALPGEGQSKKAAKHMAADAALHILQVDVEATNEDAAKTNTNSVGTLQEMSLQRGWRLPEFTVLVEAGPLHRREFTVTCRLESLSETARGNSKKAAKKAAADKMLEKLQALSGSSGITWAPRPRVRLEDLRNSLAGKISSLRRNPLNIPNTDYIQLLSELSKEQSFAVAYFDIDEPTTNGQYQCLAELSTSPVTVCHGTGISHSNAHNAAAHSALQYIKIIATNK